MATRRTPWIDRCGGHFEWHSGRKLADRMVMEEENYLMVCPDGLAELGKNMGVPEFSNADRVRLRWQDDPKGQCILRRHGGSSEFWPSIETPYGKWELHTGIYRALSGDRFDYIGNRQRNRSRRGHLWVEVTPR